MPGETVDTRAAQRPARVTLRGRYVEVVPIDAAKHGAELYPALGGAENAALWTYMFDGPFTDRGSFDAYLALRAVTDDPCCFAIIDAATKKALGMAVLMRIEPLHRVIEIGGIIFSRELQRTRWATEAMYLLARYVFDELGYRRYEWKCNALHTGSRHAALRLGFSFEGIFRHHMIIKGRTRDTAWYAMIDADWPAMKAGFERWLAPENFDAAGRQRTALTLRAPT